MDEFQLDKLQKVKQLIEDILLEETQNKIKAQDDYIKKLESKKYGAS